MIFVRNSDVQIILTYALSNIRLHLIIINNYYYNGVKINTE
jgi:hypothetical protein